MASSKLILDRRSMLKNGTSPLAFRISHKSKVLTIATGFYLSEEEWDKYNLSKSPRDKISELQCNKFECILNVSTSKLTS
ncbi:MAG: hypothetical protein JKY53_11575 [Flavobacteriales bacterium]|nr:hypothetical protein [Flavobacteriales bacterium]